MLVGWMNARSWQCSKKGIGEKIFKKTLKFPETRPITHPEGRDWVEKYLRTTLKFAKSHPITSQKGSEGQQKNRKIFRFDPKVPESVDVNQHRRRFLLASAGPKSPAFRSSPSALSHRGATTIRQGLSDKLLRVALVFAGRKIQTLSNTLKVSSQSESISTATQNRRPDRSPERWK
jgi:hypothetical protein